MRRPVRYEGFLTFLWSRTRLIHSSQATSTPNQGNMSSREYSGRDGGGRGRDRDRDRDYDRNRGGRYDDPRRDRDRGRDNSYRPNRDGDRERERGHDRDRDRPRDRDDHRDHGRDRYNGGSRSEGGDRHAREEQPTNAQPPREDDKPPQQSTSSSGWDAKKEAENDPTWARIYISNLPTDITSDELQELFGSLGVVAREKQKRGYKDQWPFKIKVYTDDAGQVKGDAVLTYEDANAARAAPSFFDGHELRGNKIKVELAGKPEPPVGGWQGGGSGGGGRGRGGGGGSRYGGGGGDSRYGGGDSRYGGRGGGDRDFRGRSDYRHRPY